MNSEKEKIQAKILEIEAKMAESDFWSNKEKAQETIKELQNLKDSLGGIGKCDRGDAIMTILSGAGGDDSEDFSAMLVRMYRKYCENKGWSLSVIHSNENDHGGFRNIDRKSVV